MLSLCLVPLWLSITSRFLCMFSFKSLSSFNFFTKSLVCESAKFEQSPPLATHRSVSQFRISCSFAFTLLPPYQHVAIALRRTVLAEQKTPPSVSLRLRKFLSLSHSQTCSLTTLTYSNLHRHHLLLRYNHRTKPWILLPLKSTSC